MKPTPWRHVLPVAKEPDKPKLRVVAPDEKPVEEWRRGLMTLYTPELAEEICLRIAGGEHLRRICRDDHMPHFVNVYQWAKDKPEFAQALREARRLSAEALVGKVTDIAEKEDVTPLEVPALKMRAGLLQWLAAKYNKEEYGDFKQTENRTTIEEKKTAILDVSGMSDEELEVLENALKKTALKLEFDGGKK